MTAFLALILQATVPDAIGTGAGIGGLGLAGVIFYFYRQERSNNQTLTERAFQTIEGNTAAMTKLTDAIDILVSVNKANRTKGADIC